METIIMWTSGFWSNFQANPYRIHLDDYLGILPEWLPKWVNRLLGQPLITGQKRPFSAGYGHHDILGFMATNLNAIYQRTRTILSPKSISLRLLPVTNWPCLILRIDLVEQTRPSDRVGAKQQTCSGIHRIFTYLSYVRCVDASYLPSYKFYIALEHGPLIHLIQ